MKELSFSYLKPVATQQMMLMLSVTSALTSACNAQEQEGQGPLNPPEIDRPNIVFILADDMGYGDIHKLNPGSAIPTPNIDKLCNEGMRFSEAHSGSAVSTPTRYGLLTGRYCFRSSMKSGVLGGYSSPLIETTRPTIASVLKHRGYYTACIGKWHLGLGWNTYSGAAADETNTLFDQPLTYSPNDVGFDESYILPASLDMAPYVYIKNKNVVDPVMTIITGTDTPRGNLWRAGKASQSFSIPDCLDHFIGETKRFLRGRGSSNQPFFLYMPLTAPHTPWLPAERFRGASNAGNYGDFVMHVDDVVGQVVYLLDSLGIKDRTLIVFTSDNGADWNANDKAAYPHLANFIWRGRKSDVWDGGHHIPLIVRYPAMVKAGTSSDALVCLTDILATFAEITGATVPFGAAEDSKSFLPVLNGSESVARSEVIHHSNDGKFAIRQGRWKFINWNGSGGWTNPTGNATTPPQLYDMDVDPEETTNLYSRYPQKVEELNTLLDAIVNGNMR
ncbi:MAG: arylsulfatase [Tannerellaceae bacterium]|jgi:arylsulfatase A-like enzyme|nr:arylsulfatase [Tannerellaceae bacterium]